MMKKLQSLCYFMLFGGTGLKHHLLLHLLKNWEFFLVDGEGEAIFESENQAEVHMHFTGCTSPSSSP